jgi:hypothetical protein
VAHILREVLWFFRFDTPVINTYAFIFAGSSSHSKKMYDAAAMICVSSVVEYI